MTIRRALISVSDKTGLAGFGRALAGFGVEVLSTGGSAAVLREAGVAVVEVADFTGFPEIMDGRVKTLQPKIHGGLLAVRGNPEHEAAMTAHGIAPIDLLCVNLYPFEETVARGADAEACIETIDIGGPALIRAGAKNHAFVTVVTDPGDYACVLEEMSGHGGETTFETRQALAAKAYARTGAYDAAISAWFARQAGDAFPDRLVFAGTRRQRLRYGENPHQRAAFYVSDPRQPGLATAEQVQGKELSFNNLNDTDAAFDLVAEFDPPAVAIIKHANPCGVAVADDPGQAWVRAFACDPVSAFGGIVAVNRVLDGALAEALADIFLEVVIAPDADADARRVLSSKQNLRLLLTGAMPDRSAEAMTLRSLAGGYLLQSRDNAVSEGASRIVTRRAPTGREAADLTFAFTVCKHVKSNAIVFCKDLATVGIGAGQMSRVDSARIAAWKAEEARKTAGEPLPRTEGAVVGSDAFFPFPDGLLVCAEAGATAVIQPGGSVRDEEVIAAANAEGMAMLFTGMRHFRH